MLYLDSISIYLQYTHLYEDWDDSSLKKLLKWEAWEVGNGSWMLTYVRSDTFVQGVTLPLWGGRAGEFWSGIFSGG